MNFMNDIQSETISVIGLGYIGLPLACTLVSAGYTVKGIDNDPKVIKQILNGHIGQSEPGLADLIKKTIINKRFELSADIIEADIYIIAVGTPLGADNLPDLSTLQSVINKLIPLLKLQNAIFIESTCPIGTTQNIAERLPGQLDLRVAYCAERVFPSNVLQELVQINRIVGGINETSTLKARQFYASFIKGMIFSTDAKTAEAVKLAENTYRDINIAYANSISMIAERYDINVFELIELANQHPRVNILRPGIGVGGHCVAIDPWFLYHAKPDSGQLIVAARKVNQEKTQQVIKNIKRAIAAQKAEKIACLGLTYKANVSDIRESPAMVIVESLASAYDIVVSDPFVDKSIPLSEVLEGVDFIIILVAHDCYKSFFKKHKTSVPILDVTDLCLT